MPKSNNNTPVRTPHKRYSDTDAGVILNVAKYGQFRVHSYYLKASSVFFRDMLSNDTLGHDSADRNPSTVSPAAITMDFPHVECDVELFLDLMHRREIPTTIEFGQYERLLKMCDRYGCDLMAERIINRLHSVVQKSPWKIFCIASQINDIALARAALRVMAEDKAIKKLKLNVISLPTASACTLPYFLGFVRLASQQYISHSSTSLNTATHGDTTYVWSNIADSFRPVN